MHHLLSWNFWCVLKQAWFMTGNLGVNSFLNSLHLPSQCFVLLIFNSVLICLAGNMNIGKFDGILAIEGSHAICCCRALCCNLPPGWYSFPNLNRTYHFYHTVNTSNERMEMLWELFPFTLYHSPTLISLM